MEYSHLLKYVYTFGLSMGIVLFFTPLFILIAPRFGLMDHPSERRIHKKPIPLAGGIVVFLAFHLTCFIIYRFIWPDFIGRLVQPWSLSFLFSSTILLFVGLYDDARDMHPLIKLAGQTFAILCMFFLYGKNLNIFGFYAPLYVNLFFILIYYLAIINAFNLIDGMDGLCSGLATISSMGLAVAYILSGHSGDSLVCLALAGACLGFLSHNFHPARVFLGDSGSMFLGFTLASISLYAGGKNTFAVTLATPFFIAGVPIIDTILAIWRRSIRKVLSGNQPRVKIMQADREHLHHRLLDMGLTQSHVALILYASNLVIVISGLAYAMAKDIFTGLFLVMFVAIVYVLVKHTLKIELWETSRLFAYSYKKQPFSRITLILYPLFDLIWLSFSYWLSSYIAFDGTPPFLSMGDLARVIPLWIAPSFFLLYYSDVYSKVWKNSIFRDYLFLTLAIFVGTVFNSALLCLLEGGFNFDNISLLLLFCLFALFGIVGIRIPYYFIREWGIFASNPSVKPSSQSNILLYGAGALGGLYIRERYLLHAYEMGSKNIIGFIDDNKILRHRYIYGKKVLGGINEIKSLVKKYHIHAVIITAYLSEENYNQLNEASTELGFRIFNWRAYTASIKTDYPVSEDSI